ncbi:sterol desaturase family protein [Qipengyuania sp. 1NDH17]|uniref:Sterol desaturase family protein n=1 Tax=Qipengyuania polymorpha TaxID=2867234 RepID=A0ABS7IXU4_9SPHN|nr:sterol desaturase family protein [Qipengyuania polymorpha]MBX7458387.1 sterol desaturase family protein [Qipengyuania polymorpha]
MNSVSPQAEWLALGAMAAVFALFAVIELARPATTAPRGGRWVTNLALFAIDTLAVRLLVPLLMVGAAALAAEKGWGLLNQFALPAWAGILLAILALDLALYFQHWATHRVPLLWRLHKVHHSDPGFDVTTAARFHPFEIVLSMGYKMAVVVALGLPVLGVFLFELVFNLATLFTHANFALPRALERPVRALLVTPSMHRIHHSAIRQDTDSNYGTLLSGWDRLFGTYTREAEGRLTIGLGEYQDTRPHKLGWSLLLPFRK